MLFDPSPVPILMLGRAELDPTVTQARASAFCTEPWRLRTLWIFCGILPLTFMSGAHLGLTRLCIEASHIIGSNFSRIVVVPTRFAG